MFKIVQQCVWLCVGFGLTVVLGQPPAHELAEGGYNDSQSNLPGARYEFKVNVGPGKQECFYQNVKSGSNLHVAFEVLRGADRNLDFVMFTPNGEILDKHLWTSQGVTDTQIDRGGIFAFCMDNTFSRFSSKLVYFFLSTFVPEEWQHYSEELQEFDLSVSNFTQQFAALDKNIVKIQNLQVRGRQHAITDWYIIRANQTHVQNWSILTCVVIMLTGAMQAYFVKRLFLTHEAALKATSTTQARA